MREVREMHSRYKIQPETVDNDVNTMTGFRKLLYAM